MPERTIASGIFASLLAACTVLTADAVSAQTVTGSATYRERISVPAGAVFEATLEDVSRADAPAVVIATTRVESPGNPPIAFTIPYDKSKIVANHRYVVRAKILVDGKLLFTNDSAVPVNVTGGPATVAVMLRRVGAAQTTKPSGPLRLDGSSWQLVRFQGGDGTTLTPDDRAKYTIAFAPGGQLTARVDCNRGRGTWTSGGPNQLQFGPLALTRAVCPPGSLHDQIVKQWSYVRSYVIKDGHLHLSLMADGGIYEFEPMPVVPKQN